MADSLSDQILLTSLLAGDEDALLALHGRYAGVVYSVAYRVLGERMAAEEVTQDTFLRLWDRAETYDPARGALLPWLLAIARRRAIDVLRYQQRRQPPQHETFSLDEHPYLWEQVPGSTDHDLRRTLIAGLESLPEEQRQAIALAYFYGLSHSDIAAHLGAPLGTVKTRIRLGMQKLREFWLADQPTEHPIGSDQA